MNQLVPITGAVQRWENRAYRQAYTVNRAGARECFKDLIKLYGMSMASPETAIRMLIEILYDLRISADSMNVLRGVEYTGLLNAGPAKIREFIIRTGAIAYEG